MTAPQFAPSPQPLSQSLIEINDDSEFVSDDLITQSKQQHQPYQIQQQPESNQIGTRGWSADQTGFGVLTTTNNYNNQLSEHEIEQQNQQPQQQQSFEDDDDDLGTNNNEDEQQITIDNNNNSKNKSVAQGPEYRMVEYPRKTIPQTQQWIPKTKQKSTTSSTPKFNPRLPVITKQHY